MEIRESLVFENEGKKIFGMIHHPVHSEGGLPAVVCCHGFAGDKVGRFRFYVDFAKKMAEQGFVVLRFDFRGTGDSEGDFSDLTIGGMVSDTLKALDQLIQLPFVDKKRIGLLGRSMGGLVAVMSAAQCRLPIQSLCLWSPVFSPDEWKERVRQARDPTTPLDVREKLSRINGQIPSPRFLEQFFSVDLSPHLQKIGEVPLLHLHGERDETVPLSHADNYKSLRSHAKAESRFIRFPKSDHSFSETSERIEALHASCEWFQKTL